MGGVAPVRTVRNSYDPRGPLDRARSKTPIPPLTPTLVAWSMGGLMGGGLGVTRGWVVGVGRAHKASPWALSHGRRCGWLVPFMPWVDKHSKHAWMRAPEGTLVREKPGRVLLRA